MKEDIEKDVYKISLYMFHNKPFWPRQPLPNTREFLLSKEVRKANYHTYKVIY